jgi:hypothetical protein
MTLRLATSGQGVALGRMALVFEELSNGALVPAVATSIEEQGHEGTVALIRGFGDV